MAEVCRGLVGLTSMVEEVLAKAVRAPQLEVHELADLGGQLGDEAGLELRICHVALSYPNTGHG